MLDVVFCDVGLEGRADVFFDVDESEEVFQDAELFFRRDGTAWTIWCGCASEIGGKSESSRA